MFSRVSISLENHQWITNLKILRRLVHCYDVKNFCETYCEQSS
jgi:hypothetical protein